MTATALEHINFTVSDPDRTAALLSEIFGWQVRWAGNSIDGGRTVHVGSAGEGSCYLALYTNSRLKDNPERDHLTRANLNHIGIEVPDLNKVEQRVIAQGLKPCNHAEYEPGHRFYFHLDDGIEVEVISYK